MEGDLCASWENLRGADARHVLWRNALGMRACAVRHGAVLLSERLDTSFFQELEQRFRGCDVGSKACQFSQAYVIAHEVGHHVQNLLGILPKAQSAQQSMDKVDANRVQVRVELQADCLAGVWAHHSEEAWKFIEPGDVEAAMQTSAAIGDDRLQRQAQGYVVPDAFTHGSSEQRTRWFTNGLKSGKIENCDTFS